MNPGSDRSVTIEPLRTGHGPQMFEVLRDEAVYEYLDEPRPESIEQVEKRHAFMLDPDSPPADERWLNWLINERQSGRSVVVGTVQATVNLPERSAVIAYILSPNHWGRGIASAAVKLMLVELIDDHDVQTVQAFIDPANQRSIDLVERLGFAPAQESPDDEGNLVYERVLITDPKT